MKNYIYYLLGICLQYSCTDILEIEKEGRTYLPISTDTVNVEIIDSLLKYDITDPEDFIKYGQWLIVGRSYEDYQICAINLKTGASIKMLKFGKETGEALGITSMTIDPQGNLAALDYRCKKLHEFSSPLSTRSESRSNELQLNSDEYHLSVIKGNTFMISTGLYENGRYRYYSEITKSAKYYLSYPNHPQYNNLSTKAKSILYASSVLRLRPDNKFFVCADMYSGIIEICKVENDSIQRVFQHCFYYPKVKINDSGLLPHVAYYKDNIAGFQDIAVSNEKIYVLFSGQTYRDAQQAIGHCTNLFTFDWNGNLISSVKLNEPIYKISFDTQEDLLYGLKGTFRNVSLVHLYVK